MEFGEKVCANLWMIVEKKKRVFCVEGAENAGSTEKKNGSFYFGNAAVGSRREFLELESVVAGDHAIRGAS
jgi:hypothetical protein